MRHKLRILVTGMVGQYPLGGVAWDYLQYVVGFRRLGCDVYYHEDTRNWPFDPVRNENTASARYSLAFIGDYFARYAPELQDHWHYRHLGGESHGLTREQFREIARTCDLFLNVSGTCQVPDELAAHCTKIFLDTDPGYNQIVLAQQRELGERMQPWSRSVLADYDQYFTYAENIHGPDCLIPTLGLAWQTTRMPIVLELWNGRPLPAAAGDAAFTTVMTWNNFHQKLVFAGREYGSKDEEFEKVVTLPQRVNLPLRVAIGGMGAPIERLRQCGWDVIDGPAATRQPGQYQDFIRHSLGEFSIAKNVYVAMRSGWFSCRSACYLAAGRPVVVQDTGFSRYIPTGEGVVAFGTVAEAAAGLAEVRAHYGAHCRAARAIAESRFDCETVLGDFLKKATGQCAGGSDAQ